MILVILQNAWAVDAQMADDFRHDYDYWVEVMASHRTGRRLSVVIPSKKWNRVQFVNTTSEIGDHSGAKLPPDYDYLQETILEVQPKRILACGEQAKQAAVSLWEGPLLCIPHPTYRLLTNRLLQKANALLFARKLERIALQQKKGKVKVAKLS